MSDLTWTNERRRLKDLQPWPRNPRQIKTDQAKRLVQSFDEFGQVETIAIGPDNGVYNGHQRLNVLMQQHGGDYEVDVRVSSRPLEEKEREKLTVFLHKGAAGEWDFDTLANEFELDDLLEWGFERKDLDLDLWAGEPAEDPGAQIDKADELRQKWGVESGQLWQLGEHRLICGDCTDRAVVERVMGGEKADMVFTDPPYNIDYKYNEYEDDRPAAEYLSFVESFIGTFMLVLSDDCPVYIMSANNRQDDFKRIMTDAGLHFHQWLYWIKPSPGYLGRSDYIQNYETVNYSYLGKHRFYGKMQLAAEVINRALGKDKVNHPAQRPVELLEKILNNSSLPKEIVLDVFLGSGTTLIACERLGRKCRAVEISPAYCAVAIQRWVDMTGGIPLLVNDG